MTKIKLIIYNSLPREPILNTQNEYVNRKISLINNAARRASSSVAYSLLESMLKENAYQGLDARIIRENEYGKPYFSNSDTHFNLAHSENALICAISDSPIGVDIERIGEIKPMILNKCFSDKEASYISSPDDFYKLWTLKEAYVKAIGVGISKRLSEISFTIEDNIRCTVNGSCSKYNFISGKAFGYAY